MGLVPWGSVPLVLEAPDEGSRRVFEFPNPRKPSKRTEREREPQAAVIIRGAVEAPESDLDGSLEFVTLERVIRKKVPAADAAILLRNGWHLVEGSELDS